MIDQTLPMIQITLTLSQKNALELRHKQSKNGKERDRLKLKAVLLRSEGWSIPLISEALRTHQTSIVRHLNEYIESGKLTLLNPIERLWKVMHEKVRNNQYFKTPKEFRQKLSLFFDEVLPKIGPSLDSCITDNFQVFNRAFSS